jgi:hypothetical protein
LAEDDFEELFEAECDKAISVRIDSSTRSAMFRIISRETGTGEDTV